MHWMEKRIDPSYNLAWKNGGSNKKYGESWSVKSKIMEYSGIEEIICESDKVPYLSGIVKLTMTMNQEKVAISWKFWWMTSGVLWKNFVCADR